jgi:hypothetical protein
MCLFLTFNLFFPLSPLVIVLLQYVDRAFQIRFYPQFYTASRYREVTYWSHSQCRIVTQTYFLVHSLLHCVSSLTQCNVA